MVSREEIELALEEELAPEIQKAVSAYRDELELLSQKPFAIKHSQKEIEELVKAKEREVKLALMRPKDRDRIEEGFQILLSILPSLPEYPLIQKELDDAPATYEKNKDQINLTPQELLGMSKATYDTFYSIAYKLFLENKFDESASCLLYLTNINPNIFEPQLLLGYAYQALNDPESALLALNEASSLNPTHLEPPVRSIECYILLKKPQEALQILQTLERELSQVEDFPKYAPLLAELKSSLSLTP